MAKKTAAASKKKTAAASKKKTAAASKKKASSGSKGKGKASTRVKKTKSRRKRKRGSGQGEAGGADGAADDMDGVDGDEQVSPLGKGVIFAAQAAPPDPTLYANTPTEPVLVGYATTHMPSSLLPRTLGVSEIVPFPKATELATHRQLRSKGFGYKRVDNPEEEGMVECRGMWFSVPKDRMDEFIDIVNAAAEYQHTDSDIEDEYAEYEARNRSENLASDEEDEEHGDDGDDNGDA